MQPRPTASELLEAVARVLEEQIVPALSGPVQHNARVAASLVSIVERELRLSPAADATELATLRSALGADAPAAASLADLRTSFASALRSGLADDDAKSRELWSVLMAGVKSDLAVVKPGHDGWSGD
jgi:Domain of unknown function (DUF6285)